MIAKEKTTPPPSARRRTAVAGDAAERQMALYLRRQYAEDPAVQVFNDLRIERAGETAPIDHLILHKHGMIIIESKSVTGEVHVDEQLEFTRVGTRKRTGIPSPIEQAKRQGVLLRELIVDHKETLRRKVLFGLVQGGFRHCPVQVLVAISDDGIIERPKMHIPELHKADQIVGQVQSILNRHRRSAKLTSPDDGQWGSFSFSPDEFDRVTQFLLERHVGKSASKRTRPKPASTPSPKAAGPSARPPYRCRHCESTKLEVRFGRTYYFKCLACDGNTAILNACRKCGAAAKTRKRGEMYSAVCSACKHIDPFFRKASRDGAPGKTEP